MAKARGREEQAEQRELEEEASEQNEGRVSEAGAALLEKRERE